MAVTKQGKATPGAARLARFQDCISVPSLLRDAPLPALIAWGALYAAPAQPSTAPPPLASAACGAGVPRGPGQTPLRRYGLANMGRWRGEGSEGADCTDTALPLLLAAKPAAPTPVPWTGRPQGPGPGMSPGCVLWALTALSVYLQGARVVFAAPPAGSAGGALPSTLWVWVLAVLQGPGGTLAGSLAVPLLHGCAGGACATAHDQAHTPQDSAFVPLHFRA
jgi:hypothetical protein